MKTLSSYLQEYAQSHQNPTNILIHNICVPLIAWSVLGFFFTFAINDEGLKVAHVIAVLALIFYASFLNARILMGMTLFTACCLLSFNFFPYVRWVSIAVFVLAWIGQFYGHKIEGKKPSFFQDLLFLLIGPVWVLQKAAPGFFRV
jgi:uncharacterized membrane protein YGL010W